jgi:hypothetical protein
MSIPTSLIIVVLVAAWLAVLVPMAARRREAVPETEVDSRTFRVLRRASASIRRRPGFGRRDQLDEAGDDEALEVDELGSDEALDQELLDEQSQELLDDEDEDLSEDDYEEMREEEVQYTKVQYEEMRYEEVQYDEVQSDEAPYQEAEPASTRVSTRRGPVHHDPLQGVDESHLRPVPRRHGRGGYDPDAAELAKAYRYTRRRRVTVILLLATVGFSAAAYLIKPVLWSGTAVFGVLLVAYLGYLRRQVRIENDIQHRRQERLRRARQIRPEYHLDRRDEPVTGSAFGRRDLVTAQVPPSGYRRGREIIDLDDDDPSFDDLDYYQPIQYRRASGQ